MATVVVELAPVGQFWQVTRNGEVFVAAVTREGAINAAARLLRSEIKNPELEQPLKLVGLELTELQQAKSLDPNWKRKGPRLELERFEQAEAYLRTELVPPAEAALLADYRAALDEEDFSRALGCLVQLGESQACTNPFWKTLEWLLEPVWPTKYMVDRREKGRRETTIAKLRRRAERSRLTRCDNELSDRG